MAWSKAARDAAIAARRAKARGAANKAAAVSQYRTAATIGNESMRMSPKKTPAQVDAEVRAAGERAKARRVDMGERRSVRQREDDRAAANRAAGKPKPGTAGRTGLAKPATANVRGGPGDRTRSERTRAAASRSVAGTPSGKQLQQYAPAKRVAGNTRATAARNALRASVAVARSEKGTPRNRYGSKNTGGIVRSTLKRGK